MPENSVHQNQSVKWMEKLGLFVESRLAQNWITALIVLNAVTLGLETEEDLIQGYEKLLSILDSLILAIFSVEILIKLLHRRLSFFKNGWNIFDFVIISIALIPSSGPLSVLRTLRIFRAMRLLSVIPSMRKVIQALFVAIPGILSVGSIIILIFYVSAVLSTNFFGNEFEQWFGNIGRSMFTLFQIMTLESWSMGIVRPIMNSFSWAWVFFVPFILVTSFAVLNLFIGIIVDAMQTQSLKDNVNDAIELGEGSVQSKEIRADISQLRQEVKELTKLLKSQTS